MLLVVGLGNPGARYERTRHNVGFRVVDELAREAGLGFTNKFEGVLGLGGLGEQRVAILKPLTFMNLSGDSVAAAAKFFKLSTEDLVVIHDELDLEFGRLQIKIGGGHAGHNGLRSIAERLGDPGFARLRVGIGRPPPKREAADWVLSEFSRDEERELELLLPRAVAAARAMVAGGAKAAMNSFNGRSGGPATQA